MWVRGPVVRNAPRRSVVCLGNNAPLLSGAQRVGPLLPHTPAPVFTGTGRGSHQGSVPQSVATARHQRQCTQSQLWLPYPSLTWGSCAQSAAAFTSCRLGWGDRHLRAVHTQRWGQNQSWAPGTVLLRKRKGNLSLQLHKLQIKSRDQLGKSCVCGRPE